MILKVLIFVIFVSFVVSDDSCVKYNFEENFNDLFSNNGALCNQHITERWIIGEYSNLDINRPNNLSTKFITPSPGSTVSCMSTFPFKIYKGGVIEFEMYTESEINHFIQIVVYDKTNGQEFDKENPVPAKGWRTVGLKTNLGPNTYEGYVSTVYSYSFRFK